MSMSRLSVVRSRSRRSSENARKSPPEQTEELGLGEAEQPRGLGLGDAGLPDDSVDAGHQFGLHDVCIGVGKHEVGEDVVAAGLHGGVGYGRYVVRRAISKPVSAISD